MYVSKYYCFLIYFIIYMFLYVFLYLKVILFRKIHSRKTPVQVCFTILVSSVLAVPYNGLSPPDEKM